MTTTLKTNDNLPSNGLFDGIDPTQKYDPLFSGIDIGRFYADEGSRGTLGCFIHTTGLDGIIPNGNYLLSCYHVLAPRGNIGGIIQILQPSFFISQHTNNPIGQFIYGRKDDNAGFDCAISTIINRHYENKIPDATLQPPTNNFAGIRQGIVGEKVYKFGATTGYTTGTITAINNNVYTITNNDGWAGGGDSGSLLMSEDHHVLGLNYSVDVNEYINGVSKVGYAYDITTQLAIFANPGGQVTII